MYWLFLSFFFFFKQKTAYEMRISDWSSDVCSSDLPLRLTDCSLITDGAAAIVLASAQRAKQFRRDVLIRAASQVNDFLPIAPRDQIGRAACRERECQYVWISVVAGSLKKKKHSHDVSACVSTTRSKQKCIRK